MWRGEQQGVSWSTLGRVVAFMKDDIGCSLMGDMISRGMRWGYRSRACTSLKEVITCKLSIQAEPPLHSGFAYRYTKKKGLLTKMSEMHMYLQVRRKSCGGLKMRLRGGMFFGSATSSSLGKRVTCEEEAWGKVDSSFGVRDEETLWSRTDGNFLFLDEEPLAEVRDDVIDEGPTFRVSAN